VNTLYKLSFLEQVANGVSYVHLFDFLTDTCFFIKDREGGFIAANLAQQQKFAVAREEDIIGKTDFDFFTKSMAEAYRVDDQKVMDTGKAIEKKVELVSNPNGSLNWHITSKVPLFNRDNQVIGIMGVMREMEQAAEQWRPYRQFEPVIHYIDKHYRENIKVGDLASVVNLSVSQFEKRFRLIFNITPSKFLIRYRIVRASNELIHTENKIIHIAVDNGFFDHSHFSREFKRIMGMSPGVYRKQHG